MKKLVSWSLVLSLVAGQVAPCWAQAAASTTAECSEQGRLDATRTSTSGAFTVGLLSGFGLGLIGTGLAWGFQATPRPDESKLATLPSAECREAFRETYGREGKARKRGAALTGGLIGTAIIVTIVVASGSSN
jgi:hypothetical protein